MTLVQTQAEKRKLATELEAAAEDEAANPTRLGSESEGEGEG
jgi:hypothetical protein